MSRVPEASYRLNPRHPYTCPYTCLTLANCTRWDDGHLTGNADP